MTEKKVAPDERITIRLYGSVLKAIMEIRIKREREYGRPTSMTRILNELIMEAFEREVKEKWGGIKTRTKRSLSISDTTQLRASGGYEASILHYEGTKDTSVKIVKDRTPKIANIADQLKGESKKRWIEQYGRYDESATMMKRDLLDIQVHFAKCNAERARLYAQEVPLFNISGIKESILEAPEMESVAVWTQKHLLKTSGHFYISLETSRYLLMNRSVKRNYYTERVRWV